MIQALNNKRVTIVALGVFLLFSSSFSNVLFAQQDLYELKVGHPRILMTKYDELALRFVMMEDPLLEKLKNELKKDANELLRAKDIKYTLDRRNTMLSISREYLRRIITLSLAYRIFEDDKYSDKAVDFMMYISDYPDWNPQHFLDVAEMTAAMAIGYDWNFYHLNQKEKEIIRNSIVEKGLNPGLEVYNNPDDKPHVWHKMKNNWNQVCAGGLAVGEDFPDLKNTIIYQAVKNLMPTLDLYAPDGVWYEGPAYWGYANSYLAMTLSALNSALEHDFGLSKRAGIDKTAEYYVNSISPTGKIYNFADAASSDPQINPALFWFSKFYNNSIARSYHRNVLEKAIDPQQSHLFKDRGRFFFLSIPWFDDGEIEVSNKPIAQKFTGPVDLLFFNGNATPNAIYLAAKAGQGTLNHQQLDAGSFVIDSNGERWGIDLGAENYFLPDFFQKEVDGGRWQYFRNTNKSHSTLVIDDNNQYPDGKTEIVEFESNMNLPFGVIDLTKAYPESQIALRGFKLLNEDQVLVRDEVTFSSSKEVKWGFVTDAKVTLDGKKVELSKNGKSFFLQAYINEDINFEVEPARAYHKEAKANTDKSIVFLHLNKDNSSMRVEISVVMGNHTNGLNQTIVTTDISNW